MVKKIKSLILLSTFHFLLFSNRASAAGLVPCGGSGENPCNWCFFGELFSRVVDFIMKLVFPLAAVMIVVGGAMIMTAGGSSGRFEKGKEMITGAVIGILVALLSWIFIDTIISMFATGWNGIVLTPWNRANFGCSN